MNEAATAAPERWWRRRVLAPIVGQLKQGTTPKLIAVTIAAGIVIGVFPILGSTTLICGVFAAALRLNQPVIQLVNYLVYPVQIALLFPFYRAGEKLFQQPPVPIASLGALSERFWASPQQFFVDYGLVALYGVVVWCLLAPILFGALYVMLGPPLAALASRIRREPLSG